MDVIRSGGNWRGKRKVEIIRILYSCIIVSKKNLKILTVTAVPFTQEI